MKRSLETDVKEDVRGDLQFVLVAILQGKRETTLNEVQVREDTEALYNGGEKCVLLFEYVIILFLIVHRCREVTESIPLSIP